MSSFGLSHLKHLKYWNYQVQRSLPRNAFTKSDYQQHTISAKWNLNSVRFNFTKEEWNICWITISTKISFNKTEGVTKPNLRKTRKFRRASYCWVFKLTQRKCRRKCYFVHQQCICEVTNFSIEAKMENEILGVICWRIVLFYGVPWVRDKNEL